MNLLERWVEIVEPLVRLESPSGAAERLRDLAQHFASEFERRGARVELKPAPGVGEHLIARIGKAETGRGPLLVVGHLDTVHPVGTLRRLPFEVGDERVRGPGVYDMKGGLAALLVALELLQERGEEPADGLEVLITCDEETGSDTSRELIESLGRSARAALVLEPCVPGGGAKTARKGVALYILTVTGRPAHAGIEPQLGASAVHELVRLLGEVLRFADIPAGTTVNAGTIEGGTTSNVVAETARAAVDVRFWSRAEAERVDAAFRALSVTDSRCALAIRGGINRYPLESTAESRVLLEVARREAEAMGFVLEDGRTGGASDGNFLSGVGCPTLDGLGLDGGGAHTMEEHVLCADVPRRIEFYTRLLKAL